jgi:hypothetical protein
MSKGDLFLKYLNLTDEPGRCHYYGSGTILKYLNALW